EVLLPLPEVDPNANNVRYAKLLDQYRANPSNSNQKLLLEYAEQHGFNYFIPTDVPLPDDRKSAPGILSLDGFRFHTVAAFHRYQKMSRYGYNALGFIFKLILTLFNPFLWILTDYCRPSGSADAVFENFNQEVSPVEHVNPSRLAQIMPLIHHFFAIKPFCPIAFPDLRFYKWSLVTSADYHAHHSKDQQDESAHYWKHLKDNDLLQDRFDYSDRPRSKGYFFNSVLLSTRTIVHNIKYHCLPFQRHKRDTDSSVLQKLSFWFMKYPTVMYVRSQISKLSKLKVRPVYNAPFLFILIEAMLTLALMAQCRLPDSCLMWGFETVRGGMQELNRISYNYDTFIMIDWSRYDQLLPYAIIYHFWCTFLPQLIRVDLGYMPTEQYTATQHKHAFTEKHNDQKESNPEYATFASRLKTHAPHIVMFSFIIFNLLAFIWLWYVKMVFVTPDGFGYVRLLAGVPSGIFMTQICDSFCNAFLLIDAMLEFGFTPDDIKLIRMFIQGDDNVIFYLGDFTRIFAFYEWLPEYCQQRWHMTISVDKSSITRLRNKIEVLGYTNLNGMPHRDCAKLIATLAYPERYVQDKTKYIVFMSRAIGIAYANAGHDRQVHDLCQRAYLQARKDSGLSYDELKNIKIEYQKLGFYEIFSVNIEELREHLIQDVSEFPNFHDIRDNLRHWHGPHTVYPMWPRHFDDDLSSIKSPHSLTTLYDVMQSGGLTFDYNF
ncbi:RNA-dependent RNA polymerase, partial [Heterobasidion partitivirus 2]